ncbi:WecB UDP-N-acetylglucosamine 2-epimerase [Burkholderiales bacterium]
MKIDVLSGKRGGYGAIRPMLRVLYSTEGIDLKILVTDQHLDSSFGMTVKEIREDFDNIVEFPLPKQDGSQRGRCIAMSKLEQDLANYFDVRQPDLLVLFGDRGEVLAAAAVATLFNIRIAHFQGGDLSGSVDEHVRHAVTKLSHFHFVSCVDSYNRVVQLGEAKDRVFVVGDSHVDEICSGEYPSGDVIIEKYNLNPSLPLILLLQHSETTSSQDAAYQINQTIGALESVGEADIVAIYPCSDPGYTEIVQCLTTFSAQNKRVKLHKNIDAYYFRGLMNVASVLVGNSSAGIIEAQYFNLPVVNIGNRQHRRMQSSNILNVKYDTHHILSNIKKAMSSEFRSQLTREGRKIYGNGNTGAMSAKILIDLLTKEDKVGYLKSFVDIK